MYVRTSIIDSSYKAGWNYPIDFKLCKIIPIAVMYNLTSEATILSLQESLSI